MEELQVAPAGRVQISVGASATFSGSFDYFVYTSDIEATSAVDVRRYGAAITGASTTYVRSAKPAGTLIRPRIVAIDKAVTTDGVGGVFVLSTLGYPNGYSITGIVATTDTAARALDFPLAQSSVLTRCKNRLNGTNAGLIRCYVVGTLENGTYKAPKTNTDRAYDCGILSIVAHAAYEGDAEAQTLMVNQLKAWRENRSSSGVLPLISATWTGNDPFATGGYSGNYDIHWLTFMIAAVNTPAVYDLLPAEGKLACWAYIEWVYAVQCYALANRNSATAAGGNSRIDMLGYETPWMLGAEPNISASNAFCLVLAYSALRSVRGLEYLATRGFTSLSNWHGNWTKSGFAEFLNTTAMRKGQVAGANRVCDNLYRMAALAAPFGVASYTSDIPSNATMTASWRIRAGLANWRYAEMGHALADTQGLVTRSINRSFGAEAGSSSNLGAERSGTRGTPLDLANPNKTADPPTGGGGPRVCFQGLRWFRGFAMFATVAPVVTASGPINSASNIVSGTGTDPDFKGGIPQARVRVSASSTTAQKKAAWDCTDTIFNRRRGRVMAETYGPCPFNGQTGLLSEMDTVDTGSFYSKAVNSYTAGPRSSSSYSTQNLWNFTSFCVGSAILKQGPKNLLATALANMSGSWSSGDAGWSAAARPNTNWYSTQCYTFGYTAGQTGNSGELLSAASPVVAGRSYQMAAQMQMASGAGSVTVKARFFNSGGAEVGTDQTIYSGSVSTTLRDKDALITAPSGATTFRYVFVVAKGSTTGPLRVGGPGLRYAPLGIFDWNAPDLKESLERARRGIIHLRYAFVNGWYDVAKIALILTGTSFSNSNDETFSGLQNGTRQVFPLLGFMINTLIPWWRKNLDAFPAYGAGYTGWDWEAPVTTATNSGLVAK